MDKEVPPGALAFSVTHRQWASLSLNQEIEVSFFDPSSEGPDYFFASLNLELDFFTKGRKAEEMYDSVELSETIHKSFDDIILTKGQVSDYKNKNKHNKKQQKTTKNNTLNTIKQ